LINWQNSTPYIIPGLTTVRQNFHPHHTQTPRNSSSLLNLLVLLVNFRIALYDCPKISEVTIPYRHHDFHQEIQKAETSIKHMLWPQYFSAMSLKSLDSGCFSRITA